MKQLLLLSGGEMFKQENHGNVSGILTLKIWNGKKKVGRPKTSRSEQPGFCLLMQGGTPECPHKHTQHRMLNEI